MGTQLRFYRKNLNSGLIVPTTPIPADHGQQTYAAPQAYWDCNLLEPEGEQRFKQVVDKIKWACGALGRD